MREGWTYKELGEVCDFYRGLTYSGKDEVDFSTNIVLRSNNVDLDTFSLNFDELKYISEDIIIPKEKMLKKGALLMCMSNGSKQHLGKVAFIDKEYPYAFGGFMGQICPKEEEINPKYLYYYCCSPIYKTFLQSIGNGANINNLRFSDLSQNIIPLPPKSQQEVIVSELDEINSLLALKREQLQKYDKLAQSLFYEMFGDPVENEKGWEVKKLGEATSRISYAGDIKSHEGKFWLLNLDMVESQTGRILSKVFVSQDEIGNSTTSFNEEYVLYSKLRPYLNKVVLPDCSGYCTTELVPIKPNKEELSRVYLCYLLRSSSFVNMINIKVAGAKMPRVTMSDFWTFNLPLPPLSLQQQFASRIEQIESQKQQVQAAIEKLETLLASRMQYWFE